MTNQNCHFSRTDPFAVILTDLPIFLAGDEKVGATYPHMGIIINANTTEFYSGPNTLAHELGHFAGYKGNTADGVHSSDPANVMYDAKHRAEMPSMVGHLDADYCKKVLPLAK